MIFAALALGIVQTASAPLFRDPIYDGAADPIVIYNPLVKKWWMFYTQRRAKLDLPGVGYCHGTDIGVAVSSNNGNSWAYKGALKLDFEPGKNTFWAPDIVKGEDGQFHMFVTYVKGTPNDWSGERHILHYTSKNLWDWKFIGPLPLTSDRCIDACLFQSHGKWMLWYKDEGHSSQTFAVQSTDLFQWTPASDPNVSKRYGEGPKVFEFGGNYWLIKDPDSGLDIYRSSNFNDWTYQGKILEKPGIRNDDGTIGKHCDVVVSGSSAYIFYFTHPHRTDPSKEDTSLFAHRRTSIQVAELKIKDGVLTCDRNADITVNLVAPKS